MRTRINLKAGGKSLNHTEHIIRKSSEARSLKVKANVKAGKLATNHNQTVAEGLRVKSSIKAGGLGAQHNQTVRRG